MTKQDPNQKDLISKRCSSLKAQRKEIDQALKDITITEHPNKIKPR